jgi:ribonuclease Z
VDLDLLFLGTAASAPTARRSVAATVIRRGGERILVDCGEGTQRQLMASAWGLAELDLVLLTHTHGDHVLGLPGLLKTFSLRERRERLRIGGPGGTGALLRVLAPLIGRLAFPVEVLELGAGGVLERDGYRIEAIPTVHSVPSVGYALVEADRRGRFDAEEAARRGVPFGPLFGELQRGNDVTLEDGSVVAAAGIVGEDRVGRRVVLSGDTRPCDAILEASISADVLVHEATFLEEDLARARETRHSTAREAAELAAEARVDLLCLTHLSTRYPASAVKAEARAIRDAVEVPRDFDVASVPYRERGRPELVRGGGLETAEPPIGALAR